MGTKERPELGSQPGPGHTAQVVEAERDQVSTEAADDGEDLCPVCKRDSCDLHVRNGVIFRTLAEACAEATDLQWIVPGIVGRGVLSELDGKVKRAGKTTFALALARAVTTGSPFLGRQVERGRVLFATEQPPASWVHQVRRAGLAESAEIFCTYRHELAVNWPDFVAAATEQARLIDASLLVVDTLTRWTDLADENSVTDVQQALDPLQKAAAEGLGVLLPHHDRKAGGGVGESGRGSTGLPGGVDIILHLFRPANPTSDRVRVLDGIGRFNEVPGRLVIELAENGASYELADPLAAGGSDTLGDLDRLLEALPEESGNARTVKDLLAAELKIPKGSLRRLLTKLEKQEKATRLGKGVKGDPSKWYRT